MQSDSNPTDNLRKRDGSICCAAGIELRRRTAGSRQTLSIAPHCVFHVQHHVLALKKNSGPGASTSAITRFLQWSRTAFTALSRLMALAVPPLDRRCSFQFWLSGWPGTGSSLEGFGSEGVSETLLLGRLLSTLYLQTREREVASCFPCSLLIVLGPCRIQDVLVQMFREQCRGANLQRWTRVKRVLWMPWCKLVPMTSQNLIK